MSLRWTTSPPTVSRSVIIPLSWISIWAVSRAAAPGNGTWSSDHPVIAWYEATYSSFQSRSHRLTYRVTSPMGASVRKPWAMTEGGRLPSDPTSESTLMPPTRKMSASGPMWRKSTGVASTVRLRSGASGWCAA